MHSPTHPQPLLHIGSSSSSTLVFSLPLFFLLVAPLPLQGPQVFHRLSLLELVRDTSVPMVRNLMSQSSDFTTSDLCNHGWSKICSRVGLSEGLRERHHLINCWHSERQREKAGQRPKQSIRWAEKQDCGDL